MWSTALAVLSMALTTPQATGQGAPAHVVANGHPVEAIVASRGAPVLVSLKPLCAALGAGVVRAAIHPETYRVTLATRSVTFAVGSRKAGVSGAGVARRAELPAAPQSRQGTVYVPVELAALLGASVKQTRTGEIRISGEAPSDPAALWARALGLSDATAFHRGSLRIRRISVRAPRAKAAVGTEMVVNVSVSSPAYVQLYEVMGGEAEAVLGRSADGRVVYYPEQLDATPAALRVDGRLQVPVEAMSAGLLRYIAVASDQPFSGAVKDLGKECRRGGEWAISAAEIEVGKGR